MREDIMVMPYDENTTQHVKDTSAGDPITVVPTIAARKHQRSHLDALIANNVITPVKKCCHYISETSKAMQARPGQLWISALPLIILLLATLFLLLDW